MSDERKRILGMLASGKISVDEAEDLLAALGAKAIGGDAAKTSDVIVEGATQGIPSKSSAEKKNVKFLRVTVDSVKGDKVNVRVPMGLLRAGVKLSSLLPKPAMDKVSEKASEHGFKLDLNNLKPEELEALIQNLGDLNIDVVSAAGDKVQVFCE
jgi:hypothetical protein